MLHTSHQMEIPKKRVVLSICDKMKILQELEDGKSNASVCKSFNLKSSTVATIWKYRDKVYKAAQEDRLKTKRMRICEKHDLDQALFKWFKIQRSQGTPISGPILQLQVEKFARESGDNDFKCSSGWISRFKKRHNITFGKISLSVDDSEVNEWIENVWKKVKDDYKEEDVFNLNESGVFYNLLPDRTLCFKGEKCVNGQLSEERVTVLFGANMCGTEKRKLLVIGNSENPRCFKNVKKLPVKYRANENSFITSELFINEFREWDSELRKMGRKILVFVDNCPAHCTIENLTNIQLIFFPPNVTSILQPMDQGIIKSFKFNFRKNMLLRFIVKCEHGNLEKKVSLLEAINFMAESWDSVSAETIRNCFKKSRICTTENLAIDKENTDNYSLSNWICNNNINIDLMNIDDYVSVDDELIVNEIPTDQEILQSIISTTTDNVPNEKEYVSSAEALLALETLLHFFETNEVDDAFYEYYSQLKTMVNEYSLKQNI